MRLCVLPLAALTALATVACGPTQTGGDKREDKDNEPPAPEPCVYPEATALTGIGSVMPNVRWAEAFWPDGTTIDFSLEGFHCDAEWDAFTSVTFVLVADWCPNCPDYLAFVKENAAPLEAAGSFLVIVDLENASQTDLVTSVGAHTYVNSKIGPTVGLRVGDGDADPRGLIYQSSIWSAVPGAFVVRKSDMKVVANQDIWPTLLNLPLVASHLDADWTDPDAPPFFNECADGDEEASEPNNTNAQAAPLSVGTISGGICDTQADYFTIDLAGDWEVELAFDAAVGDLDVYALIPGTNDPVMVGNTVVGSYTVSAPETFTHAGPVDLIVMGYIGASAPYTLTLSER